MSPVWLQHLANVGLCKSDKGVVKRLSSAGLPTTASVSLHVSCRCPVAAVCTVCCPTGLEVPAAAVWGRSQQYSASVTPPCLEQGTMHGTCLWLQSGMATAAAVLYCIDCLTWVCRYITPNEPKPSTVYFYITPLDQHSCRVFSHAIVCDPIPKPVSWLLAKRPRWLDHLVLNEASHAYLQAASSSSCCMPTAHRHSCHLPRCNILRANNTKLVLV